MAIMEAATLGAAAMDYAARQGEANARKIARKNFEKSEAERLARIQGLGSPDLREYDIPVYDNLFDYTPEEIQAIQQERSALESFRGDPRFEQSQVDALRQLSEYAQGGLTEGDRLAMEEAQLEASQADRGRQEAILQAMARRGVGGGGQELAARLASSQQASDSARAMQRSQLQAAQQRALSALSQQGALSTTVRGQQFDEAARRAAAADAINRFNTQNQMNTQAANVEARNKAALMRNQSAQSTANMNVGVAQQQAAQRNQLQQQQFNNAISREGLVGPTSAVPAQMQAQEAAIRAQAFGNIAQAAAGAATSYSAPNNQRPEQASGRTAYGEPIYG